jgi:hypothetical protein
MGGIYSVGVHMGGIYSGRRGLPHSTISIVVSYVVVPVWERSRWCPQKGPF